MSILYEVTTNTLLRGRELYDLAPPIPCNPGTTGLNCICPGNCLTYYNSTGGCHPNDCWKWNTIKNQCEEDGKPYIPALVLQGIPFTGMFGSGFGNMGRWDIFLNYMMYIFGGCIAICCLNMCFHRNVSIIKSSNTNNHPNMILNLIFSKICGNNDYEI